MLTKMNSKLWHKHSSAPSAERICDIVRFMFVCKTMKDMATLLDQFRESKDIDVVRFKDRIKEPNGGWRDAMINFRVKDHICEVQIVHQRMRDSRVPRVSRSVRAVALAAGRASLRVSRHAFLIN